MGYLPVQSLNRTCGGLKVPSDSGILGCGIGSFRGENLFKLHKRGRREGGQTLILITLALPLFFALMSLVVDGGNILVHKRNLQVAADAAALAAARDLASRGTGPCTSTCLTSVQSSA